MNSVVAYFWHKQLFFSRISNIWGVLAPSFFQDSYKLPSSKSYINKHNHIYLSINHFVHYHFGEFGIDYGALPNTTYYKIPMKSSIYGERAIDLLKN